MNVQTNVQENAASAPKGKGKAKDAPAGTVGQAAPYISVKPQEVTAAANALSKGQIASSKTFTMLARDCQTGNVHPGINEALAAMGDYTVTTLDGAKKRSLRQAVVQAVNMNLRNWSTPKDKDGVKLSGALPTLGCKWDSERKELTVGKPANKGTGRKAKVQGGQEAVKGAAVTGGEVSTVPVNTPPTDESLIGAILARITSTAIADGNAFGLRILQVLKDTGVIPAQ